MLGHKVFCEAKARESEAREIGEEQETEMKGSSVEDNRHIDLYVE